MYMELFMYKIKQNTSIYKNILDYRKKKIIEKKTKDPDYVHSRFSRLANNVMNSLNYFNSIDGDIK